MLTDAFLVRMTVVTAVMKLAGERTWWAPEWLARLHRRVEGHPEPAELDVPDDASRLDEAAPAR